MITARELFVLSAVRVVSESSSSEQDVLRIWDFCENVCPELGRAS